MREIFRAKHKLCVSAVCLLLAACAGESDPASQSPVDPEPGLYEVTLGGAGLLKNVEAEGPHEYCLRESERADFAHILARNYYQLHALCRAERGDRQGNAVDGEIICAADPKMAQGSNSFVYTGAVAERSASVDVRMKLDATVKEDAMSKAEPRQLRLGMKLMEQFHFKIDARRIGDCS